MLFCGFQGEKNGNSKRKNYHDENMNMVKAQEIDGAIFQPNRNFLKIYLERKSY